MPLEEYERELLAQISAFAIMAGMGLITSWAVLDGSDSMAYAAIVLLIAGGVIEWVSGWYNTSRR